MRSVLLLVCALAASALWPAPARADVRPLEFQRGVTLSDWGSGGYPPDQTDERMRELRAHRVRWVTLLVVWESPGLSANSVEPSGETVRIGNLRAAIRSARRHGLRVMLRAYIDVQRNRLWRGFLLPDSPAEWFAAYTRFALRYAAIAREERVGAFGFAAEMRALSALEEPSWRALAAAVRRAFPGPVVYEANWDEVDKIAWWDAVDAIAVSAYHPTCATPTRSVSALTAGWARHVATITAVHERFARPVLFTEIGYRPLLGSCMRPWERVATAQPRDEIAQAAAYEAALRVWWPVPWWKGAHWWSVGARGPRKAPDDHDVTPAGWRVIKRWYARPRSSPRSTPSRRGSEQLGDLRR